MFFKQNFQLEQSRLLSVGRAYTHTVWDVFTHPRHPRQHMETLKYVQYVQTSRTRAPRRRLERTAFFRRHVKHIYSICFFNLIQGKSFIFGNRQTDTWASGLYSLWARRGALFDEIY